MFGLKKVRRSSVSALFAGMCLSCSAAIVLLSVKFGDEPLAMDHPYHNLPSQAVDTLFWVALVATIVFVHSLRHWWYLGRLLALPLLVLTTVLAVTGGMWIDGSQF